MVALALAARVEQALVVAVPAVILVMIMKAGPVVAVVVRRLLQLAVRLCVLAAAAAAAVGAVFAIHLPRITQVELALTR
jgi:hypothetical protein